MKKNTLIKFIKEKDYKFLQEIGQGGTGRTILIEDETINENFVCKKYSPFYEADKDTYYQYFKNEIKILYTLFHKNIVRVFNYFFILKKQLGIF